MCALFITFKRRFQAYLKLILDNICFTSNTYHTRFGWTCWIFVGAYGRNLRVLSPLWGRMGFVRGVCASFAQAFEEND